MNIQQLRKRNNVDTDLIVPSQLSVTTLFFSDNIALSATEENST